jgi:hypothetical protein
MQINVMGRGQFTDKGVLPGKPYIASAISINKMSDYCGNCIYKHQEGCGETASIAKGRKQRAKGRRKKISWSRFQYFALS